MPASASPSRLRLSITLPLRGRSRAPGGVVRRSSSKRDDLLNRHKPEERIRNLGELERMRTQAGTTLIKKKKRKIVKEKNPSDSDSKLKITATELNYSCKIDTVSEAEIVHAVQDINYSIDNLIANILVRVKEHGLSYRKVSPRKNENLWDIFLNMDLDVPLLQSLLLDSPSLLSDDTRDGVVEFIFHNAMTLLIHKNFFKGERFFGVDSETHHEYLETMFSNLISGENSNPAAIQRWRCMCVEAVFQMNYEIDSRLYNELILYLERMLKIAYPLSPSPQSKKVKPESIYESIVHEEQKYLYDIIRQARKISFMIQQVVSCQVLVTIVHSSQSSPDEDIFGTHTFGLQKILGPDRTILI